MRENIYYWKCDSATSVETKRQSYFKEKYDRKGLADEVRLVCERFFRDASVEVRPVRADGNHVAFRVAHGGRQYFLRADDGTGDDDYMLAESRLMQLAAGAGVPVPEVYHTDVSRAHCPFRYQLMACCADPCMHAHHREQRLQVEPVTLQWGQLLRRLHAVRMDGFGFVNTRRLAADGALAGLNETYPAYFNTRLDAHVDYLRRNGLLSEAEEDAIRGVFRDQMPALRLAHGVLVHRDMALWNLMGTPDRITAVIDWDDAVSGDPADDLGMLYCLHDDAWMDGILRGYWGAETVPADFQRRVWLHMLRNMLWKAMIRHALGYFDKGREFFLNTPGTSESLREITSRKLHTALSRARKG